MAKRVDNDSTMEVSSSQLEPGRPKPPKGADKNDVSMWIGNVVGADAFTARPTAPKGSRVGLVVVLLLVIVAAGGGAAYYFFLRPSNPAPSVAPTAGSGSALLPAVADIADAAEPADATPPSDAAPDAAVATGELKVDAMSAADPKVKPAKKTTKKVVKKPVVKKKPTVAPHK